MADVKKTALVIMAAGIGSRYKNGIKQLAPVGPEGELIMDYSIRDAIDAGFDKVVFIIRRDLEEEFKRVIGSRVEQQIKVEYAFQELEDLPEGFVCSPERTKPWGTGQAVLAAKKILSEPFAVINADDYYGKEAYSLVHAFLLQDQPTDGFLHICMAGFRLGNTLSDNGTVTRGICRIQEGCLTGIRETKNISRTADGAGEKRSDGQIYPLDLNSLVSMNMWGLTPDFLDSLEAGFIDFLNEHAGESEPKEFLLPIFIDRLIRENKVRVEVLETKDSWFGVTYKEDLPAVISSFKKLTEAGVYPRGLYRQQVTVCDD